MPTLTQKINLKEYPEKWDLGQARDKSTVVVGDIHGNSLKLLYILIATGVVNMTKENYEEYRDLYYDDRNDTAEIMARFSQLIGTLEINPNGPDMVFLGDIFVDRGRNDYYTREIFNTVYNHEKSPKETHLQSDHDVELGYHYHPQAQTFFRKGPGQHRQRSEYRYEDFKFNRDLGNSFHQMIQSSTQVPEIQLTANEFFDYFTTHQRLIDYVENEDGTLTLCSHAPIGQETLRALGGLYDIPYPEFDERDEKSSETYSQAMKSFIDKINSCYLWHQASGEFYQLLELEIESLQPPECNTKIGIPANKPLARVLWNRVTLYGKLQGDKLIEPFPPDAGVRFAYGHDGEAVPELHQQSHACLNDEVGKCKRQAGRAIKEITEGELTIHVANKTPKPKLKPVAPSQMAQIQLSINCMTNPIDREKCQDQLDSLRDYGTNLHKEELLGKVSGYLGQQRAEHWQAYQYDAANKQLIMLLRDTGSTPLSKILNQLQTDNNDDSNSIVNIKNIINQILKSEGTLSKLFTKRETRSKNKPAKYLLLDQLNEFKKSTFDEANPDIFLTRLNAMLDSLLEPPAKAVGLEEVPPQPVDGVAAQSSSSQSSSSGPIKH